MKKNSTDSIVLAVLVALPLVYASIIYSQLPEIIPIHFTLDGQADKFANKKSIWILPLVLGLISTGVYLFIRNMPKIDPKRTGNQSPELYRKIALTIAIFVCGISLMMVDSAKGSTLSIEKLLLPLMGLLFAVLGNYMHSVKPNYFVGFRLPWTLEDEGTWRKTHHLVSKIWVAGGLLISLITLLLPFTAGLIAFGVIMVVMIIVPTVYSYRYFRKHTTI